MSFATPSKARSESCSVRAAHFLVGPTAVGKSAVVHRLALRRGCEILSADSMQVYKGMDIGTAKPTPKEREEVVYWGIDLVAPDRPFSAGDYLRYAREALDDCRKRGAEVLVVGGTGLYIKALTEGLDDLPPACPALREEAEKLLAEKGVEALQDRLRRNDPVRFKSLQDKNNPRRLIRALELAGRPVPEKKKPSPSSPMVGLHCPPAELWRRIEERVVRMYKQGLPDELRALRERYPALSRTAAQAIGYAEAARFVEGNCSLDEAQALTTVRTRQYAKRQMTWFRHQACVDWVTIADIDRTIVMVDEKWKQHGPTKLHG